MLNVIAERFRLHLVTPVANGLNGDFVARLDQLRFDDPRLGERLRSVHQLMLVDDLCECLLSCPVGRSVGRVRWSRWLSGDDCISDFDLLSVVGDVVTQIANAER